ncbi:EboA domain-containing protein [Streptomyces albidoflavus]
MNHPTSAPPQPDPAAIRRTLAGQLDADARAWLDTALTVAGPDAVGLVEDALRANDTGIVAAAVGPYAARHLDAHAWRHAVLKCLFTGVPLTAVAQLAERAAGDGELDRMLADFAAERAAAGRAVPADLTAARALTEATPPGRTTTPPAGGGAKEN